MGVTSAPHRELVVVRDVPTLRATLEAQRAAGRSVGFVPTMGALHDGHAELLRRARAEHDVVVCSCYVNPTQFAPGEDLARYPRTPDADLDVARRAGADVLWRPTDRDVYGDDPDDATSIRVGSLGAVLDGVSRPGHFDGVATVVVRLIGAVEPNALYLGEKDFQQVVVLRRVLRDLLLDVQLRVVPTQRDADGLARSSRNAYLSPSERRAALAIPASLEEVRALVDAGETSAQRLLRTAREVLDAELGLRPDYVELVDTERLRPLEHVGIVDAVLLVAARVGETRLIDNLPLPAAPSHAREERP